MKKIKILFIENGISVIFFLFLGIFFLGGFLVKDQTFADNENRMLQQVPSISIGKVLDGSFQKAYEKYQSDQFLGRSYWVQMKTNVEYTIGKRVFRDVLVGKENQLFQERATPSNNDIKDKSDTINSFANTYKDIDIAMLLVPNKASILKDKLPIGIQNQDQNPIIKKFKEQLDAQINWVDATTPLQKNKASDLYYRSDHHWTTKGAYTVLQSWLHDVMPNEQSLTYKPNKVHDTFYGTLAKNSGYLRGKADSIEVYTAENEPHYLVEFMDEKKKTTSLYDTSKLDSSNPYDVFLGGNHSLVQITTTTSNNRHLLILKDSFANAFIPFLLPYYHEITIVDPRYYYDDIDTLIADRDINCALVVYNFNTFFSENTFDDVLNDRK